MATLALTALGTAIGGPIGGAIGAFIGRQADQAVFGSGNRTGPRLKELSVTTSSYGQPVPRQFGRMRTAGTIIWATDLVESKSTEGGGKGKPSTTTYSYSASFAVAVSSTPITEVRRVWADGRLLRGMAGDLKVEGAMRTYRGFGDDPVDPLISADKGGDAPGFRDFAYVVFEDLQLADFGNRIPALTFEVIGEDDASVRMDRILPEIAPEASGLLVPHARGMADEGGPIANTLAAIDQVYPLAISLSGDRLCLSARTLIPDPLPQLPAQLAHTQGRNVEREQQRGGTLDREPVALRYYDEARDYQPGIQRAVGGRPKGRENTIDLPATMSATGAKMLANANAHRTRWGHERRTWRCSELDPMLRPGSIVRVPEVPGVWFVRNWEWHEDGVELGIVRLAPEVNDIAHADAGSSQQAQDVATPVTLLNAFELPPDGSAPPEALSLFASATASTSAWRGATLYVEQGEALAEVGKTGSGRAVMGQLAAPLAPSQFHIIERGASIDVEAFSEDDQLPTTDVLGLASGANRLLVGDEIIQYLVGERTGPKSWKLSGLLRGRAGTEHLAQSSHPVGTPIVLLNDTLIPLDPARIGWNSETRIAAIGRGDAAPVFASLRNPGRSRRPIAPVHPSLAVDEHASWTLSWSRRARGQWRWDDLVDLPLVEERELYLVGFGPVAAPHATWLAETSSIEFSLSARTDLLNAHGPGDIWVKQIGTYSHSPPLLLATLS